MPVPKSILETSGGPPCPLKFSRRGPTPGPFMSLKNNEKTQKGTRKKVTFRATPDPRNRALASTGAQMLQNRIILKKTKSKKKQKPTTEEEGNRLGPLCAAKLVVPLIIFFDMSAPHVFKKNEVSKSTNIRSSFSKQLPTLSRLTNKGPASCSWLLEVLVA